MSNTRPIFLHGPLGQRQIREVLSALFAGLILSPRNIWLVTPWLTDFDVMDNASGQWSVLDHSWGNRAVRFSELLAKAIQEGANLSLATREVAPCLSFIETLRAKCLRPESLVVKFSENLHIKGLLTRHFYLSGSMNFTLSGTTRWEEGVSLSDSPEVLTSTYYNFRDTYFPNGVL